MAYIANTTPKTTSTGKNYLAVTFEDGRKASAWSDHPMYNEFRPGYNVPDNLIQQKGQYLNIVDPSRGTATTGARYAPRPNAYAQRNEQIREAQERKDDSIAYFNAINSAIALVSADKNITDPETIKKWIRYWRDWFLEEHNAHKAPKQEYTQPTAPQHAPATEVADEINPDDIPF